MKTTNVLLVIVALLLLVQIIDRSREPEQIGALTKALDASAATFERLTTQQRDLQRQQEKLLIAERELVAALEAHQAGLKQGLQLRISGGQIADPIDQPQGSRPSDVQPADQSAFARDGVARPGGNFLKPMDRSHYDPDKVGGVLRSFSGDVPGTNDILTSYAITSNIHNLVNAQLCESTAIEPERWYESCATACTVNADFTEFRFTIRDGVYWQIPPLASEAGFEWLQEEVELTAHDFAFTLQMINDPLVECPQLKSYYEDLASFEAPDDRTLIIRWKKSLYSNISATLGLTPLPRHVYTRDQNGAELPAEQLAIAFNKHWFDERFQVIGVGRYRLVDYTPKKGMRFVRNPSFFGVPDHFEERFWDTSTPAPDAQLVAFKNGQVHSSSLNPSQYKAEILDGHENRFATPVAGDGQVGRSSAFGWEIVGSNSWMGIAWNCRRSQLSDVRVRQALAHLYPFERILDEVLFGLGQRSYGPVHPTSLYHNNAIEAFAYDVDQAKALLDAAGWTDTDNDGWRDKEIGGKREALRIRITYYGMNRRAANIIAHFQDACRAVGVDLAGDPVEDQEWSRRADNRSYDGFVVGWRSGLDVDFKQLWHGDTVDEPKSSNLALWSDPKADLLIDQLRTVFDPDERHRIAGEVQAIIYAQQPYLFASVSKGVFIWQNAATGPDDKREILDGVTWAFDHCHPLFNRADEYWYMAER